MEEGSRNGLRTTSMDNTLEPPPTPKGILPTPTIDGATLDLQPEEENSLELAKRTLIGKILTDKAINKNVMKSMLLKAWNIQTGVQMTDMGINVLLFTFKEEETTKRVYEEGPWNVMGNMLSLQQWAPKLSVLEIRFNVMAFWIQVHGLPLDVMNPSNAAKIASQIGETIAVENPEVDGKLLRPFIRVKVFVNTSQPLPTGFWVPRKCLPKTWVFLKYEKLQGFCFKCGKIGHE